MTGRISSPGYAIVTVVLLVGKSGSFTLFKLFIFYVLLIPTRVDEILYAFIYIIISYFFMLFNLDRILISSKI